MKEHRRKQNAGKKWSVKKMMEHIGCPNVEGNLKDKTTTIPALVGRLELYVEEQRWKKTELYTK